MSIFSVGNFEVVGSGGGSSGGGVNPQEINALINKNNNEVIIPAINSAVSSAANSYDDTKIYSTYEDMVGAEAQGKSDTLYIILNPENETHSTNYIWNGSAYEPISGSISSNDIIGMFNEEEEEDPENP